MGEERKWLLAQVWQRCSCNLLTAHCCLDWLCAGWKYYNQSIKHILNAGVPLQRLMQKTLLKHPLNVNFITSCYSSTVTFGDSIHTSAPCGTIRCGLVACLACDAQCRSLAEAPALWHSPRADFTLTWQEPGRCGSFQRSCGQHGGF